MTKKAPELKKKVPAPAPAPGAKTAKKNSGEGEFDDQNPYGITDLDLTPRCPHCAAELESPDVVLCVECGYNLATREHMKMVKAIETTSGEQFKWLLPGILCAIGVLALIGFDLFWCLVLPDMIDADSYLAYVTTPAINLWIVIGSLFGMFALGAYAVKRLILNPIAPEKTKAS